MVDLSFIIPAYNAECCIERCLDSIVKNASDRIEVIIVDDGSTDATELICRRFQEIDSRVCYYKKQNGGVATARSYGIQVARGKYLGFVDSDDMLSDDMIFEVFSIIDRYEVDVITYGYKMYYLGDVVGDRECYYGKLLSMKGLDYFEKCIIDNGDPIRHVWSCVYKKEVLDQNEVTFQKGLTWGEDFDFNLSFFSCCNTIYASDLPLYHYFLPDDTIKKESNYYHIMSEMKVAQKWIEKLKDNKKYTNLVAYLAEYFCNAISLVNNHNVKYRNQLVEQADRHINYTRYVKHVKYKMASFMWRLLGVDKGTKITSYINDRIKRK